jgi:rhodanese-related sulfurtransferase
MQQLMEFAINNWILVTALFVILYLLLRGGDANSLEPLQAVQKINHENAVVIDVREGNEISGGKIVNAVHIPLANLESRLKELEKYKGGPIVVNCRSGHRSGHACSVLRKNGFAEVYNLKGGIMAWQSANLPLSKK